MIELVKPSQLLTAITLPPQELPRLSFCKGHRAAVVRDWVDNLQATQVMQTSATLYEAIPEIPRLKTDYQNRMEILEAVRPSVQYAIEGLKRSFLNQPTILPESAQKSLLVAQSLQKNMVDGYIATIIQITEKGRASKATLELLAKNIHRAITGIGFIFLRNYQIYSHPPASLWSILNILFQVSEFYELGRQPIIDTTLKETKALTIQAAYARVLLMACARTNQLSQVDIETLHLMLEKACQKVSLNGGLTDKSEIIYAINLDDSHGPIYKSKISADVTQGRVVEIDCSSIIKQLDNGGHDTNELIGSEHPEALTKEISESLRAHLLASWGNVSERQHQRRHNDTEAEICIGLTDCHYYVCNGQGFDRFLQSTGSVESQRISRFSKGGPQAGSSSSSAAAYEVSTQNSSPGGYCLLWQGTGSAKLNSGELVGIKENGNRVWNIGVIRWVRQLKQASQFGVQLLTNSAKPFGISQQYDMGGESDFMRALYIPPSRLGQNKPTLLTASAPFQEYDKVKVLDGEQEWAATLDRVVFSTKNVQQFCFRRSESIDEQNVGNTRQSEGFDSSWE